MMSQRCGTVLHAYTLCVCVFVMARQHVTCLPPVAAASSMPCCAPLPAAGLAAAGIALVASAALGLVRNICKGRMLQVCSGGSGGGVREGRRPPLAARQCWQPWAPLCCRVTVDAYCSARFAPNPSLPPQVLCTGAAVVAYYYPKPWTFPSLILIGGLVTLIAKRKDVIKVRKNTCARRSGGASMHFCAVCTVWLRAAYHGRLVSPTYATLFVPTQSQQVDDINAGVDRLGFNKVGGGLMLAGWIVILVVVLVLVSWCCWSCRAGCWRWCWAGRGGRHGGLAWCQELVADELSLLLVLVLAHRSGGAGVFSGLTHSPLPARVCATLCRLARSATNPPRSCTGLRCSTAQGPSSLVAARWGGPNTWLAISGWSGGHQLSCGSSRLARGRGGRSGADPGENTSAGICVHGMATPDLLLPPLPVWPQVVLPMLYNDLVDRVLITDAQGTQASGRWIWCGVLLSGVRCVDLVEGA